MKKFFLMAMTVIITVSLFMACGEGSGNGPGDMTDNWPNFTNAVKLEAPERFENEHGPQIQWGFKHNLDAPHDVNTFLNSKFLLIASVGGGRYVTPTGEPPKTDYDPAGFSSVKYKVDGTPNNATWDPYIENTFQAKVNENWIIPFPHEADDIVYFVYDLSIFRVKNEITSSASAPEIVVKFDYIPSEKALGQYQAYLTNADLTRGQGLELRNDGSDTKLDDNIVLGWVTKNPGLTPAP